MTRWGKKLSEGECYKENEEATEAITTHHTSGVGMTWLFASCLVFVFVYLSFIPPVSLSTKRSAQDINHSSPILKLFQFMDGGNFPTGHWVGRSLCQILVFSCFERCVFATRISTQNYFCVHTPSVYKRCQNCTDWM